VVGVGLLDDKLIVPLEFGFVLLCCLFALLKGGAAERTGGFIVVACYLATEATVLLMWPHFSIFVAFISDFILAVGLLIVAFRYGSIWLGFAMLLQSANLCSQALAFTGEGLGHLPEAILNNMLSLLMGASIAMGAFLSWRRRRRDNLKPAAHVFPGPAGQSPF
jgi:hypothetical protein